ncbi:hypothetical protein ACIOD2_40305 [Amycolatopsis sp. NPDC088138]|uniref:hypothetical protein n=1 Tax=Amycolatopsis sp. NPDC088138 TaxID=3363938 RepID=UPI0037FCCB62
MSAAERSDIRGLLSEISGYHIGDSDYAAYFVNLYGERMIFVRERGKGSAVLLHADLDWEPKPVDGPPTSAAAGRELTPGARQFLGDVPAVGDVILEPAEALWLKACLMASEQW